MLLCSIPKDPLLAIDRLFLRISLVPFFERYSFVSPFCFTFYVCIFELDKIPVSFSFGEEASQRSRLCAGCVCQAVLASGKEQSRCLRCPGHWPTEQSSSKWEGQACAAMPCCFSCSLSSSETVSAICPGNTLSRPCR